MYVEFTRIDLGVILPRVLFSQKVNILVVFSVRRSKIKTCFRKTTF